MPEPQGHFNAARVVNADLMGYCEKGNKTCPSTPDVCLGSAQSTSADVQPLAALPAFRRNSRKSRGGDRRWRCRCGALRHRRFAGVTPTEKVLDTHPESCRPGSDHVVFIGMEWGQR